MAIVQTYTGLVATRTPRALPPATSADSGGASWGWGSEYAQIYATQPNVRTCVDFLGRNVAQLGYHVFRRVSDTDRVRLVGHALAQWISKPNPYTTRYRLFESTVCDLGIYFMAYWLKVRLDSGRIGLVRLPPPEMRPVGGLLPSGFVWTHDGRAVPLATSEVVYFNGYNPLNSLEGLSPLFTLRQILGEAAAASDQRERFWRNGSRVELVIERPREAPKWTPTQKQSWREQWQQRAVGPSSVGYVPVLEDGMTAKTISQSARDSEYSVTRKLTREECAAAYHIPQPMVGILDHATFSNIKEQRKELYTECLGPWLEMLNEGIELQLLPEADDVEDVYGEFNISEKLKGAFEEQTTALSVAVRRAFMTANEARARLNLPRIDDPTADELAAQQGGPSDATAVPEERQRQAAAVVAQHLARQASQLARYPIAERALAFRHARWLGELAADLTPVLGRADALTYAARVTDHTYVQLCEGVDAFAADREVPHVW